MEGLYWVILVFAAVGYFFLAVFVLPGLFFKAGYSLPRSAARGLKRFRGESGASIVYEPQPEYRPYINRYVLSERAGKKVMLCRLSESFTYIEYDIALFSKRCRHFKTISVSEEIVEPGFTAEIVLPGRTSYAIPVVHAVDGKRLDNAGLYRFPVRRTAAFAAAVGLLTVLAVFIVKLCIGGIFGDVHVQDFMTDGSSILITLAIAFVCAAVASFAVVGCILLRLKSQKQADLR